MSYDISACSCVAVSDSLGRVGVVELSDSGPRLTRLWKAHGYEAWITCFGPGEEGVVFSGGDDCKLCMWDLRVGTSAPLSTSRWYARQVNLRLMDTLSRFETSE